MVPDFVFIVALNTNPGNKMLPDFIHVHVSLFYTCITLEKWGLHIKSEHYRNITACFFNKILSYKVNLQLIFYLEFIPRTCPLRACLFS